MRLQGAGVNRHAEEALQAWQAAELTAMIGRLRLLEEEQQQAPNPDRAAEIRELKRRIERAELVEKAST